MLDHQDTYMMKAQVHVLKSFVIFDVQHLPQRKHYCQIYQVVKHILRGRLLASFLDHEHEGGDTRSQDGKKDNDLKIKIQDHSMQMISQLNSQEQGSKTQERRLGKIKDFPSGALMGEKSSHKAKVNAASEYGYYCYELTMIKDKTWKLMSTLMLIEDFLYKIKTKLMMIEDINAGGFTIKERLVYYKKNKAVFTDKINVINLEVKLRDNVLAKYTTNLEKVEKERDELKLILEKLKNSSKSLNTLLESQVSDKARLGYKAASPAEESFVKSSDILENQENVESRLNKGYHAVPSPFTRNYMPPKCDLRLIDEYFESMFVDVIFNIAPSDVKTIKTIDVNHKGVFSIEEPKTVMKNNFSPLIIEDWDSDDESEEEISSIVKLKTVKPSVEKIKYVKPARETVKTEESHKQHKHHPRGNQRNWNNLMSQRLGSNFKMINKACYVCVSFEHLQVNDSTARDRAVVSGNMRREVYVVKASGCWVWRPKKNVIDHVSKQNNASLTLKRFDYIHVQGRKKTAQAKKIANLKKIVKKLERKRRSNSMDEFIQDYELATRLRVDKKTTNQSLKEESNMILLDLSSHCTRIYGRIVRIKRLLSAVEVTAASYGFYCWLRSPRSIQFRSTVIDRGPPYLGYSFLKEVIDRMDTARVGQNQNS
nr:retrotransposon Orf1 [Tanacetum cinerariifolium]